MVQQCFLGEKIGQLALNDFSFDLLFSFGILCICETVMAGVSDAQLSTNFLSCGVIGQPRIAISRWDAVHRFIQSLNHSIVRVDIVKQ
jgi:hypothetical protein